MSDNEKEIKRAFFTETIRLYHSNVRKFKYRLETAEFSIFEKKLLDAFAAYKKNKKDEVLAPIKNLTIDDSFLEAFRCCLVGMIYNQHGHFEFAIEHLEKSVALYQSLGEKSLILDPLSVLPLVFGNRRELKKMAHYLDL